MFWRGLLSRATPNRTPLSTIPDRCLYNRWGHWQIVKDDLICELNYIKYWWEQLWEFAVRTYSMIRGLANTRRDRTMMSTDTTVYLKPKQSHKPLYTEIPALLKFKEESHQNRLRCQLFLPKNKYINNWEVCGIIVLAIASFHLRHNQEGLLINSVILYRGINK